MSQSSPSTQARKNSASNTPASNPHSPNVLCPRCDRANVFVDMHGAQLKHVGWVLQLREFVMQRVWSWVPEDYVYICPYFECHMCDMIWEAPRTWVWT